MIKMKNILTENMRRFGTKNLKENIKTDSELNRIVKKIQDEASRGENQTDMILAELGDFYTAVYDSGDTELIRLYNQLRMSADETPDIQRYAASKLVKYLGTNLNEQQLDLFKFDRDSEYFMDRPELFGSGDSIDYETLATDMEKAINLKDGKKAIQVAERFFKYLTVGVYEKLESIKDDPKYGASTERIIRREINKIQTVNQDVLKDSINILKNVNPNNTAAMQTIYDIIDDLAKYVD
jgi:hypothetical protein